MLSAERQDYNRAGRWGQFYLTTLWIKGSVLHCSLHVEESYQELDISLASPAGFREVTSVGINEVLVVKHDTDIFTFSGDSKNKKRIANLPKGVMMYRELFQLADGRILFCNGGVIHSVTLAGKRLSKVAKCAVCRFLLETDTDEIIVQEFVPTTTDKWFNRLAVVNTANGDVNEFGPHFKEGELWWSCGHRERHQIAVSYTFGPIKILDEAGRELRSWDPTTEVCDHLDSLKQNEKWLDHHTDTTNYG